MLSNDCSLRAPAASPAWIKNDRSEDFKSFAGETPAPMAFV
jgi:hypothetical protein